MVVIQNFLEGNNSGRPWRLVGSAIALAYAVYRILTKTEGAENNGDIILGLVISFCLFVGELNLPAYRLTRWVRNQLIIPLRKFFAFGDRVARQLIVAIAFGGTVLAVKEIFGLRLIPDQVDFVFKRGGIILLGITLALYLAMVISKIAYELSHIKYDNSVIGNEFAFYVSTISFCITWSLAVGGTGLVDIIFSSSETPRESVLVWNNFELRLTWCLCVISVIWCICFSLNVISRLFEHYRRDRLQGTLINHN